MTTPADDFSDVQVTADKAKYNVGDTITITVSGDVTIPPAAPSTSATTVTITVVIADKDDNEIGSSTLTVEIDDTTTPAATSAAAIIKSLTDDYTPALVWTIAADGLTATAPIPVPAAA